MKTALPSNRSFGWTFTGIFVLAGIYGLMRGAAHLPWLLPLAAITALVTLTRDAWLAPFNRAWMKFGELMHKVMSPLILGTIYFGVFTPTALVMRAIGRDALKMRFERAAPSYWVRRDPPGPADDSFRDLF
jgi:saxitoxin biosynthesis operon SxtJ-like protein